MAPHPDLLYIAITAWATVALVLATIFMIWWQIREGRRVARVQLAIQFADRLESQQMRAIRGALATAILAQSGASARTIEPLIDLFDSVAELYFREWLDRPIVDGAFSVHVQHWWVALKGHIEASQAQYRDTTIYGCFQRLALEYTDKERTSKGVPPISAEELKAFLRTEAE